jgi:cytochrome c-type biogenesis protein CcmH/NrfG
LLQGDSSKDQQLEDALGKALQLRPDLTEARVLLGLHYYNVQRYGLAVATMNQVKHLTPDQAPAVFLAMAYSQLKLGNRPEAKANAEKAKQFAKSAEQIDAADQVLKFLKSSQDSEPRP